MRLLVALAAGLWVVPELAEACQPWPPVVDSIVPDGEMHPANAAMVLRGHELTADHLVATVDGQPSQLIVDEQLSRHEGIFIEYYRTLALRISPPPTPGQQVHVTGQVCGYLDEPGCDPIDVAFTSDEPDLTPPIGVELLGFDLVRLTAPEEDSCGASFSQVEFDLSFPPDISLGESMVMYRLSVKHAEDDLSGGLRDHVDDLASWEASVEISRVGDDFPIDGWCASVSTIDAAGNESATTTSCSACMWTTREPHNIFVEDVWLPVPGGACDDGMAATTTGDMTTSDASASDDTLPTDPSPTEPADSTGPPATGGESTVPEGCTCSSPHPAPVPLLLAPLALFRRRRR